IDRSYSSVIEEERNALKSEIDRLMFTDSSSAEHYLRQYLEPQLAQKGCSHPDIWLLSGDEIFSHLRAELSVEWLARFSNLDIGALETLFEIAAQFGDRSVLQKIIAERCENIMSDWPEPTADEYIE
ncbi:hypothetical protein, partial [Pseudomonas viridiflava]